MPPLLRSRRSSARPSVVLPEPLSPTTPTVWPARIVVEMPSTALIQPVVRRNSARLDRKPDPHVVAPHHFGRAGRRAMRTALRLGGQQLAGIGMLGGVEDAGGGALLDDLALGHDADPVRHLADDAEVMGDQQHRHAETLLQVLQQLEDLRLDRDVQRRGRLVRDQQVGLVGECHRDHDALPLPAGQLVRIGLQPLLRIAQADQAQQFDGAVPRCRGGHVLVQQQGLRHLPVDRVQRVQRRHRFLEDHGDAVAADLPQDGLRRTDHLGAGEPDAALRVGGDRVGKQLQDRERGDGLAGAALADERDGLAPGDVEGDAANRGDVAIGRAEGDVEVVHDEQLLWGRGGFWRRGHSGSAPTPSLPRKRERGYLLQRRGPAYRGPCTGPA